MPPPVFIVAVVAEKPSCEPVVLDFVGDANGLSGKLCSPRALHKMAC